MSQSSCKVCRFLGGLIVADGRRTTIKPVVLRWLRSRLPGPEKTWYLEMPRESMNSNDQKSRATRLTGVYVTPQGLSRARARGETLFERHSIDLDGIRSKIRECENHSKTCGLDQQKNIRDLLVIDCKEQKVVSAPPRCKFVALSYVWGSQPTISNMFDPSSLPNTIRDSVRLTVALGYQYLWVDRYVRSAPRMCHFSNVKFAVHQSGQHRTKTQADCANGSHIRGCSTHNYHCSWRRPYVRPSWCDTSFAGLCCIRNHWGHFTDCHIDS